MAPDEVEIVATAVEALNRRDGDAFAKCLHPHVQWEETSDAFPGLSGIYSGPEEVQKWAEQATTEYWAELKMEVEEITAVSDGDVLLGMRISARGTASGVVTATRAWQILSVAEGRIARRTGPFWSRDEALGAVGL